MRRPSLTIAIDQEHKTALEEANARTGASYAQLVRALLDNLGRRGWEEFSSLEDALVYFWEEEGSER